MKPFSQALKDEQRRKRMAGRVAPDCQADDLEGKVPKPADTTGEPKRKKGFSYEPLSRPPPAPTNRKVIEIKFSME